MPIARRFFSAQIAEIENDPALRWFGVAVALVNTLTAIFWLSAQPIGRILDKSNPSVCWPFFETCHRWRFLNASGGDAVVILLLAVASYNALLFATGRTSPAFWLLAATSALKYVLILQDYRLVLNQHYMALWIVCIFLFVPSKRSSLSCLMVLFYLWAGLLKINIGWLSGAALYGSRPLNIPTAFMPIACSYVVVLELLIAPLLLARKGSLFWFSYLQLLLFHIASYWVVGFFYPILMFLLLSLYPLSRVLRPQSELVAWPGALVVQVSTRRTLVYGVVGVFCICQLVPRALSSDPALSGEGRMFALNMFDAPIECVATVTDQSDFVTTVPVSLRPMFLQPRIMCDPIVYFEASKYRCAQRRGNPSDPDFDLRLASKRFGGTGFETIIDIRSFCSAHLNYRIFGHNDWIHRE